MMKVVLHYLNTYRRFFLVFIAVLSVAILFASLNTEEPEIEPIVVEKKVSTENLKPTRTYNRNVKLKKDKYDLHRGSAERLGVPLINDESAIETHLKKGKLVSVEPNRGYKIHDLTHSKAVLTPNSYEMLKEIGVIYSETAGYNNFFMVTSLTRPLSMQKKLRKTNINATSGISTHSYGVSFDISYARFNGVKGDYPKEREMLESILKDLQKAKRIYVVREVKSACYHITIR